MYMMNPTETAAANEATIRRFYTAFSKLDYETMNSCLTEDIVFYDPAFGLLQREDVPAMWEMLCKRAKEFSLEFSVVTAEEEYCTAKWTATYLFSKTGRRVVNHIKAHLKFRDGKICEHTDEFSLYRWSKQAFGWKGMLLGATSLFKNKIRKASREGLQQFLKR
jgi:ketosteroid isomerase-like protein